MEVEEEEDDDERYRDEISLERGRLGAGPPAVASVTETALSFSEGTSGGRRGFWGSLRWRGGEGFLRFEGSRREAAAVAGGMAATMDLAGATSISGLPSLLHFHQQKGVTPPDSNSSSSALPERRESEAEDRGVMDLFPSSMLSINVSVKTFVGLRSSLCEHYICCLI